MQKAERLFRKLFGAKNDWAVSPVISTVIISSILLIILVIAAYISTNLLEIQISNTEFEQAKTNILLLNKVIQDVALRPGATSSIQFNQRGGGIGIYKSVEKINIEHSNGSLLYPFNSSQEFYVIKYRAGSRVSAAETILAGSPSLIVSASDSLGYIRVEAGNGIWIALDYLRVRVANTTLVIGDTQYNRVDIFVIRLEMGSVGGSGTVTIKVQNMGITTKTCLLGDGDAVAIRRNGQQREELVPAGSSNRIVCITEALIRVSIS
jgi:hypothetical protein